MSSGTTRASPALAAPPATTAIAKPDRKLREFVDRQMKLPNDAVIAREKVTNYLLVRQSRSDKSAFLESAGYTILNPDTLISDLVLLAGQNEARLVDENRFGRYYEIVGALHGPA